MADIATVTPLIATGQKGISSSVRIAGSGIDDSISTSQIVSGWAVQEGADLTRITVRSSLGEVVRESTGQPMAKRRLDRVRQLRDGGPPSGLADRVSAFRIEIPGLELAPGSDLTVTAEFKQTDGATTRADLARISNIPALQLGSRHREKFSPLLVAGQGRSGTTLMMALLSEHPSVAVPGGYPFEFREATYLWHAARVLINPAESNAGKSGLGTKESAGLGLDPYNRYEVHKNASNAAVRQWHQRDRPAQVIDFMKQQVDEFVLAALPGSASGQLRYLGEKIQAVPLVHVVSNVYPGARLIFLVRDFRDVFLSARAFNRKRGTPGFGEDMHPDEIAWLNSMGAGARRVLRYWEAYGHASLLVRYEDLVERMGEELVRIFRYLEVDHDTATVSRVMEMGRAKANPERHATTADPSQSLGRWRREFTDQEREAAMAYADVLEAFGYATESDRPAGPSPEVRTPHTRGAAAELPAAEGTRLGAPEGMPEGQPQPGPDRPRRRRDRQADGLRPQQRDGQQRRDPTGQHARLLEADVSPVPQRISPLEPDRVRAGLRDPLKALRTLGKLRGGVLLRLDSPSLEEAVHSEGDLVVSGWAFSRQTPIERIEIRLDGQLLATVRPGHERSDVAAKYPEAAGARDSGFHQQVTISGVQSGHRELTVAAIDEAGRQETVRLPIVVEPPILAVEEQGRLSTSILPGMPDGAVLFMHIPKTAGTSMRELMDSLIPVESRIYLYNEAPWAIPPAKLAGLPQEHRDRLRFVMGHFRFGVHEALAQPTRYVTMMRDPINRLVSLYHQQKRNPKRRHHARIAQGSVSVEDALRDPSFISPNQMARQISGLHRGHAASDDQLLERALANIEEHFAAVLIMEDMPRSVARLGEVLGTGLPEVPRRNVDTSAPKRKVLEPEVMDALRETNRIDVELYARARKSFEASFPKAAELDPGSPQAPERVAAQSL